MASIFLFSFLFAICEGLETPFSVVAETDTMKHGELDINNDLNKIILAAFVVFRHGDRTPDQEELDKFPSKENINDKLFFPYGKKSLTNKGKQRGYMVGEYLRNRYNSTISDLYLPDETYIQTTDFARTQMTVLTALAALFPPPTIQKWNPELNWQPVPYHTPAYEDDDFLYYYNCPRYLQLRNKAYGTLEIEKMMNPYQWLYNYLSVETKTNITTPEDIFFLDNLFQTLENVGVQPPQWAIDVMSEIKEVTKIEYTAEFYTTEMIRLASGVLIERILNATRAVVNEDVEAPTKLWMFSAHENNVAALMAASGVFYPHQPKYGSTISLELRKNVHTEKFSITAVYAAEAGGPGIILPIRGCGGQTFCDYDTFVNYIQKYSINLSEFKKQCLVH